jgi:beta-glucosidase
VLAEGAFVGVPETALSANGKPGLTGGAVEPQAVLARPRRRQRAGPAALEGSGLGIVEVIGGKALETTIDGSAPRRIRVEIDHKGGDEGLRLQWALRLGQHDLGPVAAREAGDRYAQRLALQIGRKAETM